jgi:diguanylate cyclase (GGDEF)-like protein
MSQVADQLAELTGFRDRDVLDTMLAGVLRELLQPLSVTVCHAVGEAPQQRWLVRARLCEGDVAASSDSVWVEFDELPLLAESPSRNDCFCRQEPVVVAGATHITCFPLLTDRDAVGVLEIETHGDLDADQLRTISSMLRVYRNMQGLLDYSERDMLTGLLNRKTFDDAFYKASLVGGGSAFSAEARRAARPELHAYLGVTDIDHFKRVNDRHGHLIGDEVLLLSRLMRANFRFHDRLYRFGGEEFVVLLRCGGVADAVQAFERLRAATESYPFPQVGHITVSIGFAAVRRGDNHNMAFERADKAVYWAKSQGRNRVAEHDDDLIARGLLSEGQKTGDIELF